MDSVNRDWRLLIGGELVDTIAGNRYRTTDPTTERVLAEVPDGDAADVDRAYRAAAPAVPGWRATAPRARAALLRTAAEVVRANAEELATLDTLDLGSPLAMMRLDVARAAESLDLFADLALELRSEVIPATAEHLHYT